MLLEEAHDRLKKATVTQEQLMDLHVLYGLLDLHKDDFCKIIDAVGVDTLLKKQGYYERLERAEQELSAKERYLFAKRRLDEIDDERQQLESIVNRYRELST